MYEEQHRLDVSTNLSKGVCSCGVKITTSGTADLHRAWVIHRQEIYQSNARYIQEVSP